MAKWELKVNQVTVRTEDTALDTRPFSPKDEADLTRGPSDYFYHYGPFSSHGGGGGKMVFSISGDMLINMY